MFVYKKSRFSLLIALGCGLFSVGVWGQQKANDFTRKFKSADVRLSNLSGKRLSSSRMHSSYSKRISVEKWPSTFSPFGGRRFPLAGKKSLGGERVPTSQLEIKTPLNQSFASANWERVSQSSLGERSAATASIEFRDAYYAELDKRVDNWLEKVNNMSLRDINRFQFRRNRPSEPGFPVQKAGSEILPAPSADTGLGRPSLRGVGPPSTSTPRSGAAKESYWMGPKKIRTSGGQKSSSPNSLFRSPAATPEKNFKSYPKPLFGPKKVRVQVK
jgi:hypothetical protein